VAVESLSSLDRTTLRERALQALRSAITSGQYAPGDHLGEVELAGQLGISRGTVREALRHLQQEGLVTVGQRGMLKVNELTPDEIRGLYQVRGALEGLAVATIIASPHRKQAVHTLRAALSGLSGGGDFNERVEADLGFHLRLCELAGNPVLVDSWRNLEGRIRVAIMSHHPDQLPEIMARDRHASIVDAIDKGDIAAGVEVVNHHMDTAAERLLHPRRDAARNRPRSQGAPLKTRPAVRSTRIADS
jgi:DNA-binding GntR family transcriptional regulator